MQASDEDPRTWKRSRRDAADAHRRMDAGEVFGRIVFVP
jgi:hypothetical protein